MELHLGDVLNKILKGSVTVTLEDRKGKDYGIPNHAEILDIINPADNDPWDVLILGYHKNFRSHAKYKVRCIKGIIWLPNENHKILVSIDEKGYSDEKYREDLEKYLKNYKKAHPKLRHDISYIDFKDICSSFKYKMNGWKQTGELISWQYYGDEPWYEVITDSRGRRKNKMVYKPPLTSSEDCNIHVFNIKDFSRRSTNPILKDIKNNLPSINELGGSLLELQGGLIKHNKAQIYLCVKKINGKYELIARCSIFPYPQDILEGHSGYTPFEAVDPLNIYYSKERKFKKFLIYTTRGLIKDRILQIEDVKVEAKFKGKGFCLKFLRKAVRLAREHFKGYKYIYINTDQDNYPAISCYQRLMEYPMSGQSVDRYGDLFFDGEGVYWMSELSQLRL